MEGGQGEEEEEEEEKEKQEKIERLDMEARRQEVSSFNVTAAPAVVTTSAAVDAPPTVHTSPEKIQFHVSQVRVNP